MIHRYTIFCTALLTTFLLYSSALHAAFSEHQVSLFNKAQDIHALFRQQPKDLGAFVTDLKGILVQLEKEKVTPAHATLIERQLTRYQKLTAVMAQTPFEYFKYQYLVKMLQQHASLSKQYQQLLHARKQQRTALAQAPAASADLIALNTKIQLIRSRLESLDRTLLADERTFFEKHGDKLAIGGGIAAAVLVLLWLNGYTQRFFKGDVPPPQPTTPSTPETPDVDTLSAFIAAAERDDVAQITRQINKLPAAQRPALFAQLKARGLAPRAATVSKESLIAALKACGQWDMLGEIGGNISKLPTQDQAAVRTVLARRRDQLRGKPSISSPPLAQPLSRPKEKEVETRTDYENPGYWEEKHGPDGHLGPVDSRKATPAQGGSKRGE